MWDENCDGSWNRKWHITWDEIWDITSTGTLLENYNGSLDESVLRAGWCSNTGDDCCDGSWDNSYDEFLMESRMECGIRF